MRDLSFGCRIQPATAQGAVLRAVVHDISLTEYRLVRPCQVRQASSWACHSTSKNIDTIELWRPMHLLQSVRLGCHGIFITNEANVILCTVLTIKLESRQATQMTPPELRLKR